MSQQTGAVRPLRILLVQPAPFENGRLGLENAQPYLREESGIIEETPRNAIMELSA